MKATPRLEGHVTANECPGSDRTTWDEYRKSSDGYTLEAKCNFCGNWVSIDDPQYRLDKHQPEATS
jgi:hypothetical protein